MSRVGVAALLAAAAGWGSLSVTTTIALRSFGPLTLLAGELLVAVVVLLLAMWASGRRPPRLTPSIVLLGVLEPGVAFLSFNFGVERTSSSHAGLLLGLETVFVVRAVPALPLTAMQFGVGLLVVLPATLSAWLSGAEHPLPSSMRLGPVIAVVLTGSVGIAGAFLVYNWALTRVSTATAGVSLTLNPLVALGLSGLVLYEPLTVTTAAAVCVGTGLVIYWASSSRREPHSGVSL